MDGSVEKGLFIGAAALGSVLIVSVGYHMLNQSKTAAMEGSRQQSEMTAEMAEFDKTIYVGIQASGSEVLNTIKKFSGTDVGVRVITKKSTTDYIYAVDASGNITGAGSGTLAAAQKTTDLSYINPTGKFIGNVIRDPNDTITCITFTQQ